jgi:EipB-like
MRVAMSLFPSLRILIPVACVLVAVSVCQRAFAETAATVHFAPHRAIYEINLNRSASGSGVTSLSGRMVYELGGSACEGYTQNMRFVTRMGSQDGGETINDLRNSSWEDASGKRLRFSTTQFANEIIVESSQGDVKRATADAAATVDLVKPEKSRFDLPLNTMFPMQHAAHLIKTAKRGQKIFAASVYDGSEKGSKIYLTNAVIGNSGADTARRKAVAIKGAEKLASLQSWPMSISYFEQGKEKQDAPPAYELSYRFFENGVTTDLAIDYGEFSITGALKEIVFLPESPCAASDH